MPTKNIPWKLLGLALLIIILALAYKLAERQKEAKTVSILSVSSASLSAEEDYLSITLSPKPGEVLSVSGWQIGMANTRIPLAKASGLPHQGQINEELPVVITMPTTLILSAKRSPIGVSFRENKCIGMLAYFQTFEPPLPDPCHECIEETVGYPDYNTCVSNHLSESDFFGNTWRMYLATDTNFTIKHKVVHLYDEHDKLLDTYTY